jgi:type I restriction enzyme M protein
MVALPGQLFYSTQIAVCLWFLARGKNTSGSRDRRGQTLFIDARDLGHMVDRVHAELSPADIASITSVYHSWRSDKGSQTLADVPGFARSASLQDIRDHKYNLVPGRYVGFAERPGSSLNRPQLKAELAEIVSRFREVDKASQSALTILRGLLNG